MADGQNYDFSGPFCAVQLRKKNGDIIPFWTNSVNFGFPISLAMVTEVSVDLQLAYLPKITVTLSPTYQDVCALLDSNLIEWGESSLAVQFGYTTGPKVQLSPLMTGLLMKPEVSLGTDTSITLTAFGLGGLSATTQGSVISQINVSRREVLEGLLKGPDPKNPRELKWDFSRAEKDTAVRNLLDDKSFVYTPGWKSDWFCMWEIVRSMGCWYYQIDRELRLLSINSVLTGAHKYDFSYFATASEFGTEGSSIIPLLSLSCPAQAALYLPVAAKTMFLKGIGSKDGKSFCTSVQDKGIPRNANAATSPPASSDVPNANPTTGGGGENLAVDQESSMADSQVQAEIAAAMTNMGIRLECTTLGIPDLLPGDCIGIVGVPKLSADYGIFTVRHVFNSSGYETTFTCVSNTSALWRKTQENAPKGGVGDVSQAPDPGPKAEAKQHGPTESQIIAAQGAISRFGNRP